MLDCIFIEGFLAWAVIFYLIFQFFLLCVLGCAWLEGKKEIDKKDKTITKLRLDNNELLGMYLRDIGTVEDNG